MNFEIEIKMKYAFSLLSKYYKRVNFFAKLWCITTCISEFPKQIKKTKLKDCFNFRVWFQHVYIPKHLAFIISCSFDKGC